MPEPGGAKPRSDADLGDARVARADAFHQENQGQLSERHSWRVLARTLRMHSAMLGSVKGKALSHVQDC